MKIKFEFEVSSFIDAASVEEVLTKEGIKYKAEVINGKSKNTNKGNRIRHESHRATVTVDQATAIVKMKKVHPKWTNEQIGNTQRIGAEVTRKILKGDHPICAMMVEH